MLSLKQIEDNGVQGIIIPDNVADARLLLAYICYYHTNLKPHSEKFTEITAYLNRNYASLIEAAGEGELNKKGVIRFVADWVHRSTMAWEHQNRVAKIEMLSEIDQLRSVYFDAAQENRNDVLPYLQLVDRAMALRDMEATKRVEVTPKKGELTPEAKERATAMAEWARQYNQQALLGDGSE